MNLTEQYRRGRVTLALHEWKRAALPHTEAVWTPARAKQQAKGYWLQASESRKASYSPVSRRRATAIALWPLPSVHRDVTSPESSTAALTAIGSRSGNSYACTEALLLSSPPLTASTCHPAPQEV